MSKSMKHSVISYDTSDMHIGIRSCHHLRPKVIEINSSFHGENIYLIAKGYMMRSDSDFMYRDNLIG